MSENIDLIGGIILALAAIVRIVWICIQRDKCINIVLQEGGGSKAVYERIMSFEKMIFSISKWRMDEFFL